MKFDPQPWLDGTRECNRSMMLASCILAHLPGAMHSRERTWTFRGFFDTPSCNSPTKTPDTAYFHVLAVLTCVRSSYRHHHNLNIHIYLLAIPPLLLFGGGGGSVGGPRRYLGVHARVLRTCAYTKLTSITSHTVTPPGTRNDSCTHAHSVFVRRHRTRSRAQRFTRESQGNGSDFSRGGLVVSCVQSAFPCDEGDSLHG